MTFNKIKQVAFVATSMLLLASCATPRSKFVPPMGGIVSQVKAPLTTDLNDIEIKEASGRVSTLFIYDFIFTGLSFAWQDCSIEKAAQAGSLKSVEYADYETFTVLGIFGRTTVVAYGDKK